MCCFPHWVINWSPTSPLPTLLTNLKLSIKSNIVSRSVFLLHFPKATIPNEVKSFYQNSFIIVSTFYRNVWNKTQTEARTLDGAEDWFRLPASIIDQQTYLCLELKMPIIRSSFKAPRKMLEIYFWHVRLKIPRVQIIYQELEPQQTGREEKKCVSFLKSSVHFKFSCLKGLPI